MMIAVPLEAGKLCPHFGHCLHFALIQTNDKNEIMARRDVAAPPHEPGALPNWLSEQSANLVLCSGMGPRAAELFAQKGIKVVTGAPIAAPETLVASYFSGTLQTSANICDHS